MYTGLAKLLSPPSEWVLVKTRRLLFRLLKAIHTADNTENKVTAGGLLKLDFLNTKQNVKQLTVL